MPELPGISIFRNLPLECASTYVAGYILSKCNSKLAECQLCRDRFIRPSSAPPCDRAYDFLVEKKYTEESRLVIPSRPFTEFLTTLDSELRSSLNDYNRKAVFATPTLIYKSKFYREFTVLSHSHIVTSKNDPSALHCF